MSALERLAHITPDQIERTDPPTPVLDSIQSAETYGNVRMKTLFTNAYDRWARQGSCEIFVLLGSPSSGKTYLVSDMLRVLESRQKRTPQEPLLPKPAVYYASYDDAKIRADIAHYRRHPTDDKAPETTGHYKVRNRIMSREIAKVAEPGTFIIAEMPGLVMRGDETVADIARKERAFKNVNYNASYALITPSMEVMLVGRRVRARFTDDPASRRTALEAANTLIEDEEEPTPTFSTQPFISGGNANALKIYKDSLAEYMMDRVKEGIVRGAEHAGRRRAHFGAVRSSTIFAARSSQELYLRECLGPWLFEKGYAGTPMPKDRVVIGVNKLVTPVYNPSVLQRHRLLKN